jgi:hypothetical protein
MVASETPSHAASASLEYTFASARMRPFKTYLI